MPALIPTRISFNRPLPPLSYLAPEGLPPGVRVKLRLRRQATWGVVLGPDPHPPAVPLQPVEAPLDPFPLLPPELMELLRFGADYYGAGLAHLLPLALPQGLQANWECPVPGGTTCARLRDEGRFAELLELGLAWHGGKIALPELFYRPTGPGLGRTEVRLTGAARMSISPIQARVILALEAAGGVLLEEELRLLAQVSPAVLATLERHGHIERYKRVDLLSQQREEGLDRILQLNEEQRAAAEAVELGRFGVHLLYGVTGSGKTEVYLHLAGEVLAQGKRVLWLVPEIGLTPRLLARLEARYPGQLAVGHSGLNASERQADVIRLLQNDAPIHVGVRNAVFAPLRDLGLIIVDEEHESSYKSAEHPRIHARDLAIKRAQLANCPIVLGSATPSLESWHAAQSGRYHLLQLRQRPLNLPLPQVQVVDMREAYRIARKKVVFSEALLEGISRCLESDEQALILLNRRGWENFWMCRACGQSLECPHCAVSLTFHRGAWRLRCHICGHECAPPEVCPSCGAERLRGVGEGTERIEDELKTFYPRARILRLDRDTTQRKGTLEAGLLAAEHGEVDLLVGTQMLAKGHTFPKLTLVGILNADQGLRIPDFRAAERTFQLLTQVAGRAGRAEKQGRVVLQTYNPDHPAVALAVQQDFQAFAQQEMSFRRALAYPPFSYLLLLTAEDLDSNLALERLRQAHAWLKVDPALRLLGPVEASVPKVKDRFRWQLLVRALERPALGRALALVQSRSEIYFHLACDRDALHLAV